MADNFRPGQAVTVVELERPNQLATMVTVRVMLVLAVVLGVAVIALRPGSQDAAAADPVCYTLESAVHPPEAANLPSIDPLPNCGGNSYLAGTEIVARVQPGNPDFVPYLFSRETSGSTALLGVPGTFNFTLDADEQIDVTYAQRVLPNLLVDNVSVPAGGVVAFFVDLPAGVTTLAFSLSASVPVSVMVTPPVSGPDCGVPISSDDYYCEIASPAAGRWWVGITGATASVVNFSAQLNPPPNSTITSLSETRWPIGQGLALSVFGVDFGESATMVMDGVGPLATSRISDTELAVTVTDEQIGMLPRAAALSVTADVGLPSNSVTLFIVAASDVNCDGLTTGEDALFVLRALANTNPGLSCGADANGDVVVDLADVLWIRKEIAELVTPLPPQGN